ncbi:MAG TPA: DUF5916 domain-containing protein [Gemmatimonadaceae bacterium]|nr:DUF5916 domain-containing protein [Gemmatimonadaceae bacterium]
MRTRSILLSLVVPYAIGAQTPAPPVSRAVRATGSIQLDGRLDDAAWSAAPVSDVFTQMDPVEGSPATQRTEVRVLYDDDALYIGARLHDSGAITARLGRRDMRLGDSDWFGVMLDSYHDHRTAFGFDVNPAGVQRDEVKTIDDDDASWDAVWRVATSIDSSGWTAEYRIPFSQLRFRPDSALTWGVQFERIIGRNREYAVSTFIPKRERGGVPAYGHLEGLRRLTPGSRLEVLPYTVARAEYVDPKLNPYRTRREYSSSVGADLRYRVASNLTLNASVNPDFGQVEVDPAVVNLGVYETFFQEKRPLFLEGNEIFDFGTGNVSGGDIFYSRRIGRRPTLSAPTNRADVPGTSTILGAAKLTGKVRGWSIGSLAALTGRAEARYLDTTSVNRTVTVEPRTMYVVGRGRREMNGGRSMLGGMLTGVSRALDTDALQSALRSSATVGGVDFRHETPGRRWAIRGDVESSLIRGTPSSIVAVQHASRHYFQRPDASHLEVDSAATSLFGYGMSAAVTKQGGEHWRGEVGGAITSPGYEVNDLGFANRTDRRDIQASVRYLENKPGALLRRSSTFASVRSEHNFAGEPILTIANANFNAQTLGYWRMNGGVRRQFRSFDDRLTRGGPLAIRPAVWSGNVSIDTDDRRPVTGAVDLFGTRDEAGGWSWRAGTELGLKLSSRWTLKVEPTFTRSHVYAQYVTSVSDPSYVATYGRRYVFAPLSQTELGLETRLDFTFVPGLTLETYVQPLISTGDFGDARQLVAARSYDFTPYSGAIPSLDFNVRSLRGNSVLRWEWREGSTLYVAWQQSRSDEAAYGDFDLRRDGRVLDIRPDNIFLVKMNYWLAP